MAFLNNCNFYQDEYTKPVDSIGMYFAEKERELQLESAKLDVEKAKAYDATFDNTNRIINSLQENTVKNKIDLGYEKILENNILSVFGKIYYDALPLDESAKEEYKSNIYNYFVENFRSQNFNLKQLKENSDYLNEIITEAENISKDSYTYFYKQEKALMESFKYKNFRNNMICDFKQDNVLNEATNSQKVDDIDNLFNAVGNTNDKLLSKNINIKNISEEIKNSVIETVKDEEENSKKEKELVDDIVSSKAVNESVNTFTQGRDSFSFFRSLMVGNYKTIIKESNMLTESTEYTTLNENGERKVDMDKVLFESILVYTLNEMYYKMYMKDYNSQDLRQISNDIAYDMK